MPGNTKTTAWMATEGDRTAAKDRLTNAGFSPSDGTSHPGDDGFPLQVNHPRQKTPQVVQSIYSAAIPLRMRHETS